MVILLIICAAVLGLMFYIVSDKAEEKGHDWLVVPFILIFGLVMLILSVKSCVQSGSNSSPSYDYYDDRAR